MTEPVQGSARQNRSIDVDDDATETARILVITPAHNEAGNLDRLADSVARQSLQPARWLVVDDRSSDTTADVASAIGRRIEFAGYLRCNGPRSHSFMGKVGAFRAGYQREADDSHEFVACIDADVELPPNYFEEIIAEFRTDPKLGICGGVYRDLEGRLGRHGGGSVPGPGQVFRRETYEQIGGYRALAHGGEDALACTYARLSGWTTRPLPHLRYRHVRRMGSGGGRGRLAAAYGHGRQDWDIGMSFPFELARMVPRLSTRPYVLVVMARLAGYVRGAVGRRRAVEDDVLAFARAEQRRRLSTVLRPRAPGR